MADRELQAGRAKRDKEQLKGREPCNRDRGNGETYR